jgi:hypothetical protein
LRTLSLCTCCRHYPGAATGGTASLIRPSHVSLPRYGSRVGLRIVLFEACSAFTRVTACTLALSPYFVTRYPKASATSFSSIAAPVASGWSGCRVGFAPTGKRRLLTAHARCGHRSYERDWERLKEYSYARLATSASSFHSIPTPGTSGICSTPPFI